MEILNAEQRMALLEAGRAMKKAEAAGEKCPLPPVVLLRLPNSPPAAWMLAYVTPGDPDVAFGLAELDGGSPELGFVRLSELEKLKGYGGKGVYHDPMFADAAKLDISEYADMARLCGQITLQFDVVVDHAEIVRN